MHERTTANEKAQRENQQKQNNGTSKQTRIHIFRQVQFNSVTPYQPYSTRGDVPIEGNGKWGEERSEGRGVEEKGGVGRR